VAVGKLTFLTLSGRGPGTGLAPVGSKRQEKTRKTKVSTGYEKALVVVHANECAKGAALGRAGGRRKTEDVAEGLSPKKGATWPGAPGNRLWSAQGGGGTVLPEIYVRIVEALR